jgi:hypothetical protein
MPIASEDHGLVADTVMASSRGSDKGGPATGLSMTLLLRDRTETSVTCIGVTSVPDQGRNALIRAFSTTLGRGRPGPHNEPGAGDTEVVVAR